MMRYVLCNNDAMLLVFDNLLDAEAEASARNAQAKKRIQTEPRSGYPTDYWHTHAVPEVTP